MSGKSIHAKNIHISETKTIAILLVVFYHSILFFGHKSPFFPLSTGLSLAPVLMVVNFLRDCLVPSLILCSGFLFLLSTRNNPRTKLEMLKNRSKKLVLTYFLYGALWLVPLYTLFDIPTMGRALHMDFISSFIAMSLGLFTDHLWFLWPLFWTTLFFIIIRNLLEGKKLILAGALTVLAAIFIEIFLSGVHYYCIAESGTFFVIFFIGILLYHFNERIEKWDLKIYFIIALCLFIFVPISNNFNLDGHFIYYVQDIAGALLFYFLFKGFSRTSLSDKLNNSRLYGFCDSHSMNIYLFNCPFMQIYFLLLYPIIGTNVFLTILCICILSYLSIFITVWVHDKLKKGLREKVSILN